VFFSSRRRHTRSKRDWSSDVCSSDLSKTSTPWQVFWPITSRAPHIAPYDRQTHPSRTLMSTNDVTIPDTLARPVTAYLDHLTIERGLSENTLAAYRRDQQRYLQYLAQEGVDDGKSITTHHVSGSLQPLSSGTHHMGELVDSSVNRILIAARGWHRFMLLENTTTTNPAADIKPPKTGQQLPEGLSIAEVTRLLDTPAP